MIKVILVNNNGEVNSVCSPAMDDMYTHLAVYGDCTAHLVPYDTDTSNISTWYWDGTEFRTDKPQRPGNYYNWVNNQWEVDLERLFKEIRAIRDSRLAFTDKTQLADFSLPTGTTLEQWQTYRAELRAVPSNNSEATSLDEVVWPTLPV